MRNQPAPLPAPLLGQSLDVVVREREHELLGAQGEVAADLEPAVVVCREERLDAVEDVGRADIFPEDSHDDGVASRRIALPDVHLDEEQGGTPPGHPSLDGAHGEEPALPLDARRLVVPGPRAQELLAAVHDDVVDQLLLDGGDPDGAYLPVGVLDVVVAVYRPE